MSAEGAHVQRDRIRFASPALQNQRLCGKEAAPQTGRGWSRCALQPAPARPNSRRYCAGRCYAFRTPTEGRAHKKAGWRTAGRIATPATIPGYPHEWRLNGLARAIARSFVLPAQMRSPRSPPLRYSPASAAPASVKAGRCPLPRPTSAPLPTRVAQHGKPARRQTHTHRYTLSSRTCPGEQ